MHDVPPLDCLRFFESAARHQSFSRAANELEVTPAAVGYRVKALEEHLGQPLFERLRRRGVRLNRPGTAYFTDVPNSAVASVAEFQTPFPPPPDSR